MNDVDATLRYAAAEDKVQPGRRAEAQEREGEVAAAPAGELENQTKPPATDDTRSWQDVIWSEWRNTDDEAYARHLFELVGNEPAGSEAAAINLALGAIYGALLTLLMTLLSTLGNSSALAGFWLWAITIGAALGSVAAFLIRQIEGEISWKTWLSRLTFNLAPTEMGLVLAGLVLALFGSQVGWMAGWSAGVGHIIGIVALTVLLAGSLGIRLVGWMVETGRKPNPDYFHQFRRLWIWWRKRPFNAELATALHCASQTHPDKKKIWSDLLETVSQGSSESLAPVTTQLQSRNWRERFVATQRLIAAGGEAVPDLQALANRRSSPLHRTARRLLLNIGHETTGRLAEKAGELLCPRCLTRFGAHTLTVPNRKKITFYGCRTCRQSRNFWQGTVIAVLDTSMENNVEPASAIRVNWLARRTLFDFDAVEIIAATNQDVERFAVQVGNDTDPYRQGGYKQIRCRIAPDCRLFENTLRILRRTFGQVEAGKKGAK